MQDAWERTSFELENFQTNPECVKQERSGLKSRKVPQWKLTFDPKDIDISTLIMVPINLPQTCSPTDVDSRISKATKVAVLREEGINGDREMIASLFMVGFDVADVTVTDLVNQTIDLSQFKGLVFPGGFSYADVLGSARGWAASLLYNQNVKLQLQRFKEREDTFSLGVCNGCQLMALIGWIGGKPEGSHKSRT